MEAVETALRVLAALNEKGCPDPADVEALLSYAGPQPEVRDLDELAREVVQENLERRRADARVGSGRADPESIGDSLALRRKPLSQPNPEK
jgi:hypothetical protein